MNQEEYLHKQHKEKICRFAGAEIRRVVGLDAILFHSTKGRIGDDDIDAFFRPPITQGAGEGIVVANIGWNINTMQH